MSGCGCSCGCADSLPCDCCTGIETLTPETEFNRPGLPALQYRAGKHATFLSSMKAALSRDRRLDRLTSRDGSDASIALLDAWATVGDVLTFYQERIANEGFIRTATERRSALELANLVGYRPRPGTSASVFLAYTLDKDAETVIPRGSLVRSVPAAGEEQQAFETSQDVEARAAWNNLQVRLTRPHTKASIVTDRAVYLKGIVSTFRKGDPLLVQFAADDLALCRVLDNTPDPAGAWTKLTLEEWSPSGHFQPDTITRISNELRVFTHIEDFGVPLSNATAKEILPVLQQLLDALENASSDTYFQLVEDAYDEIINDSTTHPPRSTKAADWLDAMLFQFENILDRQTTHHPPAQNITVDSIVSSAGLLNAPSLPPRSQYHRSDDLNSFFDAKTQSTFARATSLGRTRVTGAALNTLTSFRPAYRASLTTALAKASVTKEPDIKVYSVLRAAPFGFNASPKPTTTQSGTTYTTTFGEWPLGSETAKEIDLEKEVEEIKDGALVALQSGSGAYTTPKLSFLSTESRADYGLAGKVTRLHFDSDVLSTSGANLSLLRSLKVFLASEVKTLAEVPIGDSVCGSDQAIELDGLYDGLKPGRWVVISGERDDTAGTSGVQASELLLLADVQHDTAPNLPGDRIHTYLKTVVPSAYCYKRDTVKIFGNIVNATNGETRKELMGSGDASILFQKFALKQPPLTWLSAATASGASSTLHVWVNDREWHEADTLAGLAPYGRNFITKTSDDGITTVVFGNGVAGSRLSTGNANVRAAYRNGIGKGGNVQSGQLTVLGSKPLGVKDVTNPLRASGGADKDSRDQIRVNAPLSVTALDRLVSVEDYASFSQIFAGIGKASAVRLTDGHRQFVHVTIAGIDDIPIDVTSDIYKNLRTALHRYGDEHQPLQLAVRAAKFLLLQAGVHINPDYQWETVAPKLRAALLDAFQFSRRALATNAYLSEVLTVLQQVEGVEYVDADKFGALTEEQLTPSGLSAAVAALGRAEFVSAGAAEVTLDGIRPAEIAYFAPDVPATIALNQI